MGKSILIGGACLIALLLTGCRKEKDKVEEAAGVTQQAVDRSSHNRESQSTAEDPRRTTDAVFSQGTARSKPVGATLKKVIDLWNSGEKEKAAKAFLLVQWDDSSTFQGVEVLNVSETEFVSLSKDEQMRVAQEAMKLTGLLRNIMFYVASVGEQLATAGDTTGAKDHFEAIHRHGEALSAPHWLELIRDYGKAATQYAQKKLLSMK